MNKDEQATDTSASSTNDSDEGVIVDPSDVKIPEKNEVADETDRHEDISAELLARAESYDLPATELESLKQMGAKSLEKVLNSLDAEVERLSKAQTTTTTASKTEKLDIKLDDSEWSPEAKMVLGKLTDQINTLNEKLSNVEKGIAESTKSNRDARINSALDNAKEYESVIGAGHSRNRSKVVEHIETLEAGYKARGKSLPSESQIVKAALSAVFPDHQTRTTKAKSEAAVKAASSQIVGRPTNRNGAAAPPGKEQAFSEIRAIRERALSR